MSERGSFRARGPSGSSRGGGRGGRGGGHGPSTGAGAGGGGGSTEKPKKENILDLGKYMDKEITVKFNGGREGKDPFPSALSLAPDDLSINLTG